MHIKPKYSLYISPNLLPCLLAGTIIIAAILAINSLLPQQTLVRTTFPTGMAPGAIHTGLILVSFLGGVALTSALFLPLLRDARARETQLVESQAVLEALNNELHQQATRDGLLGIANRREFERVLKLEWGRSVREHQPLSLLMIDVDHFKIFNDTYGHLQGDRCLQEVTAVLNQASNRPGDLLARYGGEEMVILVPRTDLEGAKALAQRIQALLAERGIAFHASPVGNEVTVSIGVSTVMPTRHLDPHALIQQADEGLYTAKANGRNQTCTVPQMRLLTQREAIG
ncbi:GGDEF domain-containing protein [Halomonas sp. ANAO-440]|uniref:diguanylate cyclase n=1 Tax=Halomonas sp. ANAO-440 TaxID=2861360 RepID=UPI001CAA7DAA|nr:diguanylate cyclase [Halomonas sp. ANAO-440]MBZ0329710.1 GGDEF domain-containing protein [Halomonas sp. ANAO-440]